MKSVLISGLVCVLVLTNLETLFIWIRGPLKVDKPAYSCDKKVFRVYEDCRRLIVDNHWELYVDNRTTVNQGCDMIATQIACKLIKTRPSEGEVK